MKIYIAYEGFQDYKEHSGSALIQDYRIIGVYNNEDVATDAVNKLIGIGDAEVVADTVNGIQTTSWIEDLFDPSFATCVAKIEEHTLIS